MHSALESPHTYLFILMRKMKQNSFEQCKNVVQELDMSCTRDTNMASPANERLEFGEIP